MAILGFVDYRAINIYNAGPYATARTNGYSFDYLALFLPMYSKFFFSRQNAAGQLGLRSPTVSSC
jgi:hypothetical protein